LALAAVMGMVSLAQAGTIDIMEQATARGSLNGTTYTNVLVTLDLQGDTSAVIGNSLEWDLNGTATVTVAGLGSDTFSDTITVYSDSNSGKVGFEDGSTVILQTTSSSLDGYGLTTSIGPFDGTSVLSGSTFNTVHGTFRLTAVTVFGDSQFSTIDATLSSPTPEPGSFVLAAAGIGALLLKRRKRA